MNKISGLDAEIEKEEEVVSKLQRENDDLTQEYKFNTQKEEMFQQQLNEIQEYNEDLTQKLRKAQINQK